MKEIQINQTKEIVGGTVSALPSGASLNGISSIIGSYFSGVTGLFGSIIGSGLALVQMASNPVKAEYKIGNVSIKTDNTKKYDHQINMQKLEVEQQRLIAKESEVKIPILELGSSKNLQKFQTDDISVLDNFEIDAISDVLFDDQGIF
ncbi:Uncharacterised protein [Mycoplasma putrefaciens]|uniref:Uncharacterized protein n=1 Tax=Mycoplasma putrefaciens (strain ATCC 15718 / NCTC 10155 / C30 KS-1 / KS-1) TaxID=743965 RepID=A0A7U4E9U5_MYCPK|nr:hypothetical protein [Mycoplasma putrefaciens]AEM68865.1 uncharacterized protein MPUT_0499 [Mycoplasma putrefaciens KS1]SYV96213.1 Uncharacterised protein [Mycoplasma putrefaciens]